VIDPDGSRDQLEVLELASARLLELRYYDRLLARELARVYTAAEAARGSLTLFRSPFVKIARRTATLFVEITDLYDRLEGALTLVGLEDGNPLGESPDSDTDHAKRGFVERAIDRICRRVPLMEYGGLHSAHGGYDGITPDQHPILGAAGPDGFYLNCGHSGTGFKTAPAVGLCMAELIVDGASKTVDISPLAPGRFAEGRLIKGNYENIWK